jgi:hypothetical protein
MELRLHHGLQSGGHDGLRYPVRDGRHPENSGAIAVRLRDLHRQNRRRKIAARRHPIPDLEQIPLQIFLELLNRAAVPARRTLVGPHLQISVPDLPL